MKLNKLLGDIYFQESDIEFFHKEFENPNLYDGRHPAGYLQAVDEDTIYYQVLLAYYTILLAHSKKTKGIDTVFLKSLKETLLGMEYKSLSKDAYIEFLQYSPTSDDSIFGIKKILLEKNLRNIYFILLDMFKSI